MNGIIIVDKPGGFTSFDVVAKLRGILETRKIGHGGTLDPMATGVLPVFVGNTAKAVDMQPRQDKVYDATLLLGLATDTGDIEGRELRRAPVTVGEAELTAVLPRFMGQQQQIPPMYSSVKINGKALYKYAREGIEVERKARTIEIFSIEYLGNVGEHRYRMRVHCSKGTYIRTLVEDIGAALGLPATLFSLRRTAAGIFSEREAHTLEAIQNAKAAGTLPRMMVSVGRIFEELPRLPVDDKQLHRLINGAPLYGLRLPVGQYAAYHKDAFVGLALMQEDGLMRTEKMFLPE